MDVMEQCQIWNEKEEYQNIIDALEALPQEERTPESDSELARAYNNLADIEDHKLYEKALALLKPHEEYFKDDHTWNFRIAYAYYYLDQEGPALYYFNKALEARPGDQDTLEMIDNCRKCLTFPIFEKSFRQRTIDGWESFIQGETELRRLLDIKDQDAVGEELVARCSELLKPAFEDISFEMGFNGEKYELILTPEGDPARLFKLIYFQKHTPKEILEKWNILVGRQPSAGFCLRAFGQNISASDIKVWTEKREGNKVALTLYCESLLPLLKEEEHKVWWLLSTLTDQILGEINAMALIEDFDVVSAPREEESATLEELPQVLKSMGLKSPTDAASYLENSYTAYQMEPDDDQEADWRMDVFAGVTRCPSLVSEYLRGESDIMDAYHRDGVAAGFLTYPVDGFEGEERSKELLDFRDSLEAAILETVGEDAVTFLGGASGIYCGYLDFIAWDLPPVLEAARTFFQESPVEWANFRVFRREVGALLLMDKNAQEEKSEQDATEQDEAENRNLKEDSISAAVPIAVPQQAKACKRSMEDSKLSELEKAMISYLGCECQYFPPMKDDAPITAAFRAARESGPQEGFVPMLLAADETLWECLIMNSDEDSDGADDYSFDPAKVAQYRSQFLTMPVKDGKAVLDDMLGIRRDDAEYDQTDWDEEVLGEMKGGEPNNGLLSYWDYSGDTLPLILARIPVKNPWEVFAYLPFGAWNDCPDTEDLMAVAKYWYEQYGAVPAAMTHDELEFILPAPVPQERAMELATQQYAFCPDVVDQGSEDTTVGSLADSLQQSKMWYFWWD